MVYHKDGLLKCPLSTFPHITMILYSHSITSSFGYSQARILLSASSYVFACACHSLIRKIKINAYVSLTSDAARHYFEVRGDALDTQQE